MFSSVYDVLEALEDYGSNSKQKYETRVLINLVMSFDFIFHIHFMKVILRITNNLSQIL